MVDADIIPSEIQWYGESPCKILVTHYRFESCPDYEGTLVKEQPERSRWFDSTTRLQHMLVTGVHWFPTCSIQEYAQTNKLYVKEQE